MKLRIYRGGGKLYSPKEEYNKEMQRYIPPERRYIPQNGSDIPSRGISNLIYSPRENIRLRYSRRENKFTQQTSH